MGPKRIVDRSGGSERPNPLSPLAQPPGFGFAVRAGLDVFEGDAVVIVMADGSDHPDDVVRYYRVLEEGYDCAFGSRFISGSTRSRLPTYEARR